MRVWLIGVALAASGASAQSLGSGAGELARGDDAPLAASVDTVSASAAAREVEVSETPLQAVSTAPVKERLPAFGIALDGGFPDFAGASVVWRPLWLVRLHGGVLFNGVGPGVRAGLTLVPFNFLITPTLTAEYGYFFGADASFVMDALPIDAGPGGAFEEVLKNLQYSFANLHLGLEMGLPSRFVLYLRAGLSYMDTTLRGSGAAIEEQAGDPNLSVDDFRIRGTVPSLKLGLLFYFG